jgi:hypothetical protein
MISKSAVCNTLLALLLPLPALYVKAQPDLLHSEFVLRNGNGSLVLRADASAALSLSLPSAVGSARQVLKTDGVSVLSWQTDGPAAIDDFSDAKAGGTNFDASFIIGHQTTGVIGSEARQNCVMGVDAFKSVTTAARNVALGFASLTAMQSGNRSGPANVAIGYRSLAGLTSQINATAIGHNAGQNVASSYFTSCGTEALGSTSSSWGSVALGYRSGRAATGQYVVAVGSEALLDVSSGNTNIAVGYQTMAAPVTGAFNAAIGYSAMSLLSSGTLNVAIGANALDALTTGRRNTALGYGAGASLSTSDDCVIIGYQAGSSVSSSNVLAIDNGVTATPLLSGNFSSNTLTINGSLALTDGLTAGAEAAATVVANAVTIDAATGSAIHITSDNNGTADVITINNGTDGSVFFIGFTTTGAEAFTIGGTTFTPTANSVGIVACRINGTWRVVSMVAV